MDHEHLRGENTIRLGQEIRQQLGIKIKDYEISMIRLVAKSKNGNATALIITR